jgi:hypothetical protein
MLDVKCNVLSCNLHYELTQALVYNVMVDFLWTQKKKFQKPIKLIIWKMPKLQIIFSPKEIKVLNCVLICYRVFKGDLSWSIESCSTTFTDWCILCCILANTGRWWHVVFLTLAVLFFSLSSCCVVHKPNIIFTNLTVLDLKHITDLHNTKIM